MLAADHYPYPNVQMPKHELLEYRRGKISLHHAKSGYDYPSIRLPHTLSKLAGIPTRIYQTVHYGALAFLVVVSSSHKSEKESAKKPETAKLTVNFARLDMAEAAGASRPRQDSCSR